MRSPAVLSTLLLAALLPGGVRAQSIQNLVPRPLTIVQDTGSFVLRSPVRIVARGSALRSAAEYLRDALTGATGYDVRIGGPAAGRATITLDLRTRRDSAEAYDLVVAPGGVHVTGGGTAGVVWGIQTLRQLLPPEAGQPGERRGAWTLPAVTIHDAPRFRWRGVLLDVGRHFFTVAEVKRQIDLYARYKLNVFHWHLTEDQGWRLEIRKYPRLTSVGAWRTEADGSRSGGFYTQRQVRDVVAYAHRRGITVVPEIEMPGHSSAAIASYPWLGCTSDTITVPNGWGVFADVYCVGKPEVLRFLEDVLDEVVALFPSRDVHIGGDEVPKDRWRSCESCRALMRREGLANESQLQSWFTRHIAAYLASKGRRLVGWDEITEGGLPPGVAVQVWRDMAHADSVARAGQDVIASPTSHVYLDYGQSGLPLARVYSFDPVPPGLNAEAAAHIMGGEAPLWSERINSANLDLMAFPRLLALSEVLWSAGPRDFDDFRRRLVGDHYARLRAAGVVPGPEDRDVLRLRVVVDTVSGLARVAAERGVSDIALRYTTDGSNPTSASPLYPDSLALGAGTVIVQPFVGDRPMLDRRRLAFEAHLARGRPVTIITPPGQRYQGTGPRTLTDGLIGSTDFMDGLWQGWNGPDLEAVVDLGAVRALGTVEGSFLQVTRSWILLPRTMTVWLSDDGVVWRETGSATHDVPAEHLEPLLRRLAVTLPEGARARYVKVRAVNAGALPAWHGGAGQPSWIFADELLIR
jgi:hexosaminidase